MLRFRLAAILKKKGWTPYRLAQVTGLSAPTAYRLADPDQQFGRFTADTLDRICEALDVQPATDQHPRLHGIRGARAQRTRSPRCAGAS